ncbi:MAG TPA: hypothetical protein PKE69_06275, partial [Pyrinomonadaceae bacterium]|nr:hypothetical protein [Pyrinomonadaceae bacterium]
MTDFQENNGNSPVSMAGIGTHEKVLELIKTYLPQPSRVVDLAAGQGAFSVQLKNLGHDILAVDFSDENWKVPEIPLKLENFDSEFAERILT